MMGNNYPEAALGDESNPSRGRGKRNVFCAYYSGCLDHAVRDFWEGWHCSNCPHQTNRGAAPEITETVNHTVVFYEIEKF